MSELVIVAGFHRSGTSMLGQLLSRAGLHLGDHLIGPNPSNKHGHLEDQEVVDIHNRILADNARSWQVTSEFLPVVNDDVWEAMADLVDRREACHQVWGFKDPRVCLFLPLWKHLRPRAKIIATFRHPSESVRSLERRAIGEVLDRRGRSVDQQPFWEEPDFGLRLWATYNRCLLRSIRAFGHDTVVTSFDDLMADCDVVAEVNRRWDVGLSPVTPSMIVDRQSITSHERVMPVADEGCGQAALDLWHDLCQVAAMGHSTRAAGQSHPSIDGVG